MDLIGEIADFKDLGSFGESGEVLARVLLPIEFELVLSRDRQVEKFNFQSALSDQKYRGVLNGVLNFISRFPRQTTFNVEELESYLRRENHQPIISKSNMVQLEQLLYEVVLGVERLYSIWMETYIGRDASIWDVESKLNEFFNQKQLGFKIIDLDSNHVYFSLEGVNANETLEEGQLFFWSEVLNLLSLKISDNNGRRWVDKPWK